MSQRATLSIKPELKEAALKKIQENKNGIEAPPELSDDPTNFQAGSIPRLLNLTGSYDDFGSFRPDLGQKLSIREPRIKEVFWCRFTDAIHPEFGKERPVIVVSRKNRLGTFSIVAPITTAEENAEDPAALKLSSNPNPNSDADCWVLPNHLYTVSHWRLQRFKCKVEGKLVTPRVSQADFNKIVNAMWEALPTREIDLDAPGGHD